METLSGTVEHPFFTGAGQVAMGNLGIGTAILTRAGPRLLVKSVRVESHPEGVWVYNCTVEGDHTFYVGTAQGGAWVHNGECVTDAIGDPGESLVIDKLKIDGYTDIGQIQNGRGCGIDIVATKDGEIFFFEVKTSTSRYSESLSGEQRNPLKFVRDRLELVVANYESKGGIYGKVSQETHDLAQRYLAALEAKTPANYRKVDVTNLGSTNPDLPTTIKQKPWKVNTRMKKP